MGVAFVASPRAGYSRTIEAATAADATETVLMEGTEHLQPTSWSPDGRFLPFEKATS